jgi:hypothetical protein
MYQLLRISPELSMIQTCALAKLGCKDVEAPMGASYLCRLQLRAKAAA